MKLIQLNMWGGRLSSNIVNLLKSELPDIVCLQEVFSSSKDIGLLIGTLESLQKELKIKHEYLSSVFEMQIMNSMTQFGNCVLSQLPFTTTETIFTNLEFVSNFNFDDHSYNVRNLQHVTIIRNDKTLHVLNHHGHHIPGHKNGDDETLRQMKQLGEYIDGLDGAVVLSGDFNLAPRSESLEQINRRLTNLSLAHKLQTTRTQLTHKKEVCDYIFVNDQIKVKSFEASDELVSDHKALILEFDI